MREKLISKYREFVHADGAVRWALVRLYAHGIGKRIVAVLFGLPLIGVVYLLKPIVTVRIGLLVYQRVGHLCANTEFWLKKEALSGAKRRELNIFIAGSPLANSQILTMLKRRIFVLEGNFWTVMVEGLKKIIPVKHWIWIDLGNSGWNSWDVWNGVGPQMSLTVKEHKKGQEVLKAIGIEPNAYICFLARDSKYLDSLYSNPVYNWKYHDYRDTNINNFIKAFSPFVSPSLKALRMGAVVNQPIVTDNPNIIDYATRFRTDFADVYVMAHCKFYVGDTAGMFILANLFRRPYVMVNMVPIKFAARGPQDLFIHKKYRLVSQNRFMTFREIIRMGADNWISSRNFEDAGIHLVENTSEEIQAVTQEMIARLDGTWVPQQEDERLQQRFRALFPAGHPITGFPSRVGAQFLRENQYLLE